jgi:hypothetical protein
VLVGEACLLQETSVIFWLGPNLLVDDYLLAASHGLRRTTHQPEKLPAPVIPSRLAPWHDQPQWFMRVTYDEQSGQFRAWYNVKNPGAIPACCYAYAESPDGLQWHYPELGLVELAGSRQNNLLVAPFGNFGLFMADDGPATADPARRYKLAYFEARQGGDRNGMSVLFSRQSRHSPRPGPQHHQRYH